MCTKLQDIIRFPQFCHCLFEVFLESWRCTENQIIKTTYTVFTYSPCINTTLYFSLLDVGIVAFFDLIGVLWSYIFSYSWGPFVESKTSSNHFPSFAVCLPGRCMVVQQIINTISYGRVDIIFEKLNKDVTIVLCSYLKHTLLIRNMHWWVQGMTPSPCYFAVSAWCLTSIVHKIFDILFFLSCCLQQKRHSLFICILFIWCRVGNTCF